MAVFPRNVEDSRQNNHQGYLIMPYLTVGIRQQLNGRGGRSFLPVLLVVVTSATLSTHQVEKKACTK